MLHIRIGIVVCTSLLCPLSSLRADEPKKPSRQEAAQKLYRWMDTLGYADVKTFAFCRIATGEERGIPQNTYHYGFVIESDGKHFRTLDIHGEMRKRTKTPDGTPAHQKVDCEPVDFRAFVAATLKALDTPNDKLSHAALEEALERLDPRDIHHPRLVLLATWRHEVGAAVLRTRSFPLRQDAGRDASFAYRGTPRDHPAHGFCR